VRCNEAVTRRDTFDHIEEWATEIDKYGTVLKVIVGNKADESLR